MRENRVKIVIDVAGKNAQHVVSKMGRGFRDLKNQVVSLKGALAGLGIGYVVTKIASGFKEAAAEAQRTKVMLEGLTGSAGKAEASFDWLINLDVPYGLEALQDTFVKLQSVGIDPTTGKMEALVDAVAAFGGTDQTLARASIAIQQMAGKGVISMEELRQQLGEAVPTAMRVMADEMGMTIGEMVDVISQGNLDATTGLNALFRGLEKEYGGASARMMKTWIGMTQGMAKAWTAFRITVMESGPFTAMLDGMNQVIEKIKEMKETGEMDVWAREMAKGILTAFQVMVIGAGMVVDSVHSIKASMDLAMRAVYDGIAKIYEIRAKIETNPNRAQIKTFSLGADGTSTQTGSVDAALMIKAAEYREAARVWGQMADSEVNKIGQIQDAMAGLIGTLESYKHARTSAAKASAGTGGAGDWRIDRGLPGSDMTAADMKKLDEIRDFWQIQADERYEVQGRGLDRLIEAENEAAAMMVDLSERTAWSMQENFSNLFFDAVTGELDSFADYAEAVFKSVARAWSDMMGQMLTQGLFGQNFSGGFLGDIFSGVFGGGASAAPVHIGAGGTTAFSFGGGGYLGEDVIGIGRASGKSYEFHNNEVVAPASRWGGGSKVQVIINEAPLGTRVEQRQSGDVTQYVVSLASGDIADHGPLARTLEATYGLSRIGRRA